MFAASAVAFNSDDPLSGLRIGEHAEPVVPEGWVVVEVRATSVNHHDLWTLKGVGLPADRLPMILGCDAAGVDPEGNEVIVHGVITDGGYADETVDPGRTLLSEKHQGTFAERVAVPARNLVPKPAELTWAQAACLPTAWLTAYRMLFTRSGLVPGQTVLIQGAGGGVSTALIMLARQAGLRVWVTSRDEAKGARAVELGAHEAFTSGARLPEKVDVVMETVGAATWSHTLRALKPGGRVVIAGATSGSQPPADLSRVFFLQLSVVGSTMGTRDELERLVAMCRATGLRPLIDHELPLSAADEALRHIQSGDLFGKIVLTP
ncbi:MAG: zinc-binding dehydrogenase [Candidatus Nanopelagicales bacterium]|jgi:NADPH:quinone reductase-like Zn-dependent oxidoreductase|nr:zinc-binding dehydrogenase [Candidatus Nanopelagicales bacterium]